MNKLSPVCPISGTTRRLYQKKLVEFMLQQDKKEKQVEKVVEEEEEEEEDEEDEYSDEDELGKLMRGVKWSHFPRAVNVLSCSFVLSPETVNRFQIDTSISFKNNQI